MRRGLKLTFILTSALLVACSGLGVGTYFFIRSPLASPILLSKVKHYLSQSLNTQVEYSEGLMDPFSTVHFENLKITRNTKAGRIEFKASTVDIHYSFSVRARALEIEQIRIEHPILFIHSNQGHETQTETQATNQPGWESLSLPVRITLKQVMIDSMDIDFEKESAVSILKSKIRDLNLRFNFELNPSGLTSSGEFSLGEPGSMILTSKKPGPTSPAVTLLASQAKWFANIKPQEKKWNIDWSGTAKIQSTEFGMWDLQSKMETLGQSPDMLKLDSVIAHGLTRFTQVEAPRTTKGRIAVTEPIILNHEASLKSDQLQIKLATKIPNFEISKVAQFFNTEISATLQSSSVMAAQDLDFSVEVKQGQVKVAKEIARKSTPLKTGLNLKMRGSVRDKELFNLEEFSASLNESWLKLTAEATGKMKEQEFQTKGIFTLNLPKDFPALQGFTVNGRLEFPWTFLILRGQDMTLKGNLNIFDVNLSKDAFQITEISGRIPVSEKLRWDGGKLKFEHLVVQNPFERVDYERLRPLINRADRIQIEQVRFEEKTYGPFLGFFSIDQNIIFAHQFDFRLSTHGRTYGEAYFDITPTHLQIGFLSRLTEINLEQVMPLKYLSKIPKEEKNLSGRVGIVFSLNKGSIDGRIDVTEIGRGQLLALVNVLDPNYQNDKMNKVRNQLGLAYPTNVEMIFQNGYMDLSVELSLANLNLQMRDIPISTLISGTTSKLVKKSQEGLLK